MRRALASTRGGLRTRARRTAASRAHTKDRSPARLRRDRRLVGRGSRRGAELLSTDAGGHRIGRRRRFTSTSSVSGRVPSETSSPTCWLRKPPTGSRSESSSIARGRIPTEVAARSTSGFSPQVSTSGSSARSSCGPRSGPSRPAGLLGGTSTDSGASTIASSSSSTVASAGSAERESRITSTTGGSTTCSCASRVPSHRSCSSSSSRHSAGWTASFSRRSSMSSSRSTRSDQTRCPRPSCTTHRAAIARSPARSPTSWTVRARASTS